MGPLRRFPLEVEKGKSACWVWISGPQRMSAPTTLTLTFSPEFGPDEVGKNIYHLFRSNADSPPSWLSVCVSSERTCRSPETGAAQLGETIEARCLGAPRVKQHTPLLARLSLESAPLRVSARSHLALHFDSVAQRSGCKEAGCWAVVERFTIEANAGQYVAIRL